MSLLKKIPLPFLIGVFVAFVFYVKEDNDQAAHSFAAHNTEPVYYTHRFEMELHKDTMFYPIIFLPDWNFVFPMFCNTWYPTCGGCIVYDNWPYPPGFPYPNFNNNTLVGWPQNSPPPDTLFSQPDSLLVAKESIALPDSVIKTLGEAVFPQSRWMRFKRKIRSLFFSS